MVLFLRLPPSMTDSRTCFLLVEKKKLLQKIPVKKERQTGQLLTKSPGLYLYSSWYKNPTAVLLWQIIVIVRQTVKAKHMSMMYRTISTVRFICKTKKRDGKGRYSVNVVWTSEMNGHHGNLVSHAVWRLGKKGKICLLFPNGWHLLGQFQLFGLFLCGVFWNLATRSKYISASVFVELVTGKTCCIKHTWIRSRLKMQAADSQAVGSTSSLHLVQFFVYFFLPFYFFHSPFRSG